jgi:sugar phosphate permease
LTPGARFRLKRGDATAIFYGFMLLLAAVMAMNLFAWPFVVGVAALLIVAAVTGVHSLMSGTAAADFGGRRATATCSGIVDGCVYLGSGVQSLGVGESRDPLRLAMVAGFSHAVCFDRRIDRLAHLARLARRHSPIHRGGGTAGRFCSARQSE